jgi:8-amino-7-oxononanoate synthase
VLPSLAQQIAADLEDLQSRGRLRACPHLAANSRVHVDLDGRALVSFCSNDYLGLACDPRLRTAAADAAAIAGFGASASRLVSGTLPEHLALENALSAFLSVPATLLFPSGYQANLGVLTALAGPDDLIVADRAVHASLLDGCRLSRAKLAVYPHLDVHAADHHLHRLGPARRRRFLLTESLFSMDGDVAPLPTLASLAKAHDAALIVDEAHAFGCLGPSGRGLCSHFGVQPDILIATLGKAIGTSGAFVAGTQDLRSYLLNRSRSFIFTTAMPVPVAAAARAALQIAASPEGDDLRDRLGKLVSHLRTLLGLSPDPFTAPIIPITLGSDQEAIAASSDLKAQGFFVQAIRPPTVPEGSSRLRITLSVHHTEQHLAGLARAIRPLSRQPTAISPPPPTVASQHPVPPAKLSHQPGLFILGTDTSVGKTSVAIALLHLLATRGAKPVPFKPVETGAFPVPPDATRLLEASLREDIPLDVVCPILLADPVAPAATSGTSPITLPALLAFSRRAASFGGPLIVESAGGLLSPYATNLTSADLAAALGLPVLLVSRNSLGTINHTSLALAELRRRSIRCLGTILVTTTAQPTPDQHSNAHLIAAATGQAPLGTLPFLTSLSPANLAASLAASVNLDPIFSSLAT